MNLIERSRRFLLQAERTVRKLKKSEIAQELAVELAKQEELRERIAAVVEQRDALKDGTKRLEVVHEAIALVIAARTQKPVDAAQIDMLLTVDDAERDLKEPAVKLFDVLTEILENCETVVEECSHNGDVYELQEALDAAVADRDALLRRLGLTDAQWSAQGGACETDFETTTER